MNANFDEVLADPGTHRLFDLRLGLLRVHKALLDHERINFERFSGRVSSGELLQLVINHSQFAWLRIVSALVTQIDEMLASEEQVSDEEVTNLIGKTRQLFTASDNEEFRNKYQTALQQEPEVVMAHSELMKLLRPKA
jgi:hypothetical protein